MRRFWRSEASACLAFCFVLEVVALVLAAASRPALPARDQPIWLPLAAFLLWRVSRGGRTSRVVLILLTWASFGAAAFAGPRAWNPVILCLLVSYAAQLALLFGPAVYQRTRPDWQPGQVVPVARAWLRPPLWMVLSALLTGVIITLLYLGSMDFARIPGCGPAGAAFAQLPDRCVTLAEGYPLRFLTAYQGTPWIDKAALIGDCAQWALVSFTILYLLRLSKDRTKPERGEPALVEHVTPV
jgi:hypothetical protein